MLLVLLILPLHSAAVSPQAYVKAYCSSTLTRKKAFTVTSHSYLAFLLLALIPVSTFQTAEQELLKLPSDFPEDQVVSDGAEALAKAAERAAAACERGQDICVCGQRLPRRSPQAEGSWGGPCRKSASGASSSAPATSPWLVVGPGRLAPDSRHSECSVDLLEQAQSTAVMAASSIELGLDPDAV